MRKDILKKMPFAKTAGRVYRAYQTRKSYETEFRRIQGCLAAAPNPLFLEMLPLGGNLGDQAIAIAEIQLLQSAFPEYQIIEIYNSFNCQDRTFNKLSALTNGHPILLTGGGNLGTLWLEDTEYNVRHILKENPDSPIGILPNTIYYEQDAFGAAELKKSSEIYNGHKNLKVFVREKVSFDMYGDVFKNLILIPDVVMSLQKEEPTEVRSGCVLCLRKDTEKTMTEAQDEALTEFLESRFSSVERSDMVIPGVLDAQTREAAVEEKLSQFRKAKVVVTDRLHAMIFCAITATPCVVVKSKSHKIQGCYAWIKNNPYIHMTSSFDEVFQVDFSFADEKYHYSGNDLQLYYAHMMQEIGGLLKKEGGMRNA